MKNVRRQIRNLREVEKFRVALLYSVRNSIFHEAKVYSEQEMAQYNVIVKYILDNLVKVLISENFCS